MARAIARHPPSPATHRRDTLRTLMHRAATLATLGRHKDALAAWARARRHHPTDRACAMGHAHALLAANKPREALAATADLPAHPKLLRLNAQALRALGHHAAAVGALYLALDADPDDPATHAELGDALFHDANPEAALPHCKRAFAHQPTPAHATTLSCVLIDLGQTQEALAVIERTLQHHPPTPELLLNHSIALEERGRMPEAVAAARHALQAAPGNPLARHHLAAACLIQGQMTDEAWSLFEGRLHLNGASVIPDHERRWTGGDIAGRTILLHAEQGMGDTLQFVRYAPLVASRGARVILAVQPPLARLLQGTPGADHVVPIGGPLPPFDLYTPLLSLPGLFRTTLATIPPPLPYPTPATTRAPGPTRVGLVWAGNPSFVVDRKRSIPPEQLAPLAGIPDIELHSLQLDAPPCLPFATTLHGISDFAETATRIAGLDLVIAVDTAVAHLAATMGKPTWLLSRYRGCWRWLQHREDSPWYPTIRILRQPRPNDWTSVIDRVRQDLQALPPP